MPPAHRHRNRYRRRQRLLALLRRPLFRPFLYLVASQQFRHPGQNNRQKGKQRQQAEGGAYPDIRNRQGLVRVEADIRSSLPVFLA